MKLNENKTIILSNMNYLRKELSEFDNTVNNNPIINKDHKKLLNTEKDIQTRVRIARIRYDIIGNIE